MKFLFILLLSALVGPDAHIIETIPEQSPDGKVLTMREATIGRGVYPHPDEAAGERLRELLPTRQKESRFGVIDGRGVYYLQSAEDTLWVARDSADIHYGTSVSRNEFGIDGGLFPSPGGSRLAYYRKDESRVSSFPLPDIKKCALRPIKYPMNGTASERLSLMVFDTLTLKSITLRITVFSEERYITAVSWLGEDRLTAQILDRSQHNMNLNLYDAADGHCIGTILSEHNDKWVEPYMDQIALSESVFIFGSDNIDGYKNLYLVDTMGGIQRLTKVDADCSFIAWKAPYLYYYSSEVSPAERHAYRVKVTLGKTASKSRVSKSEALTPERGWHSVSFGGDGSLIDRWSSFSNPGICVRRSQKGNAIELIYKADNPLAGYAVPEMEFGTVPSADGLYENHYRLLKPLGFDPSKKYPLVVYVYGGPHSQLVTDSWLGNIRMWEVLMAQKGYVVYVQDNRGTQSHGAAYEKAINRSCGQAEMQDQMVGIRTLLKEPWIDKERVGVHGWSYGGFMTLSLATTYPEVFKVAVAGGPVIDWKWYEVMYGERYMDTPQTNPEGFALTSLIGKAGSLKARTLICQGAVDDTVVWENSFSFLQNCIDSGVQVDYFPFPTARHNMVGLERVYLYDKITAFFDKNL